MGFGIYSNDYQQNINFSFETFKVIRNDIVEFSNNKEDIKFSSFLNTIIANFIELAESSINTTLLLKQNELEAKHINKKIIKIEIASMQEKLINKFKERIKRKKYNDLNFPSKFRINNENINKLNDIHEPYNPISVSLKDYIKALFEEYAELPKYKRERIYFNNIVNCIDVALSKNIGLKVSLNEYINKSKISLLVRPYKIVSDELGSKNYLVGVTQTWDNTENKWSSNKIISSIRIGRIKTIDLQYSTSNFISEIVKKQIDNDIAVKCVDFMFGELEKIKVKFDDEGLRLFKSILYLKPIIYNKLENNIFIFSCTRYQAKLYFSRFMGHAFILEPKLLQDEIYNLYKNAINIIDKQASN